MTIKKTLLTGLLLAQLLVLAACAANPAPSPEPAGESVSATVPSPSSDAPSPAAAPKTAPLPAQSVSGGGVVVTVKPLTLAPGQPASFDIAMNSHSVEIVEDMLAATVLRDGAGGQLPAIAWDGPGPGGHHREGVIRFAPLTSDPGEVVLIIRGVANVPEREFRWSPLGSLG